MRNAGLNQRKLGGSLNHRGAVGLEGARLGVRLVDREIHQVRTQGVNSQAQ